MKIIRFILISVLLTVVSIGVLVCAKKKNPAQWDNPQDNTGENWHPPTVVMMEGGAVPYRDTLYVTASATDSNGTILDYCWDINGTGYYDTTITGTLDVYLPDTGWYTVRVKARDNDKLLSQPDSVLLYATFHPPYVVGMPDFAVSIFDTFTLSAAGTDSNGMITKYLWALDGVHYTEETVVGSLRTVFATEGVKQVKVRVSDDDNLLSLPDEIRVMVRLDAPVVAAMGNVTVSIYDTVSITATSSDPNGSVQSYYWAFDGINFADSTDSGFVRYAFDSAGVYNVKVKVKDDDGIFSADDGVLVMVGLDKPMVQAMDDSTVSINDTFTVSASGGDPNGSVQSYYWAFDGMDFTDSTTSGFILCSFDSAGTHTVRVKVKDDDGIFSDVDVVTITVNLDAPSVIAMDDFSTSVFDTVVLTAIGSDPNGTIAGYLWAIDGINYLDTNVAGTLKTVFVVGGSRTVRVKAIDDDGFESAADEMTVTVLYNAPTVTAMDDTVLTIGVDEMLRATGADVNGMVVMYYWAFDGITFADSTTQGSIVHRFDVAGNYTVLVKVKDDDGLMSTESMVTFNVKAAYPTQIWPTNGYDWNYFGGIIFRWEAGSYTQSFTLRMGKVNPPTEVLVRDTTSDRFLADNLINDVNATYYWRVTAKNAAGDSAESPVFSFSINSGTHVMKYIPGGSFQMGCPGAPDTCNNSELPQHTVTVSPFYMDSTEVTVGDYIEMVGGARGVFEGDEFPMEKVNYFDMIYFCNMRSKHYALDTVYKYSNPSPDNPGFNIEFINVSCDFSKNGYRLPTEAEWEFACRAGAQSYYFFGDLADSAEITQYAWTEKNSINATHPVAGKMPNAFGLYDILGNVIEMCNDIYSATYYSVSPAVDPTGPVDGDIMAARGGRYIRSVKYCGSHIRDLFDDIEIGEDIGFRCVRPIQ